MHYDPRKKFLSGINNIDRLMLLSLCYESETKSLPGPLETGDCYDTAFYAYIYSDVILIVGLNPRSHDIVLPVVMVFSTTIKQVLTDKVIQILVLRLS